jgi:nucleoid-associated protein YejK
MISGASGRASVFIGSGQGLEMIFDEKILKEGIVQNPRTDSSM